MGDISRILKLVNTAVDFRPLKLGLGIFPWVCGWLCGGLLLALCGPGRKITRHRASTERAAAPLFPGLSLTKMLVGRSRVQVRDTERTIFHRETAEALRLETKQISGWYLL